MDSLLFALENSITLLLRTQNRSRIMARTQSRSLVVALAWLPMEPLIRSLFRWDTISVPRLSMEDTLFLIVRRRFLMRRLAIRQRRAKFQALQTLLIVRYSLTPKHGRVRTSRISSSGLDKTNVTKKIAPSIGVIGNTGRVGPSESHKRKDRPNTRASVCDSRKNYKTPDKHVLDLVAIATRGDSTRHEDAPKGAIGVDHASYAGGTALLVVDHHLEKISKANAGVVENAAKVASV